ncbi:endolytic transglycosylase MltG [Dactylosporangium sp. CA-092794]|uniref:endolytic transglycosylase MltG n=1 Tax=Dactylosporangium sp. CA-092794 TaxID=3239929 RepID=UPI003D8E440F
MQFDELDLTWDDGDERRRQWQHRAVARSEARARRRRGSRAFLATLLVLAVLGSVAAGVYLGAGRLQNLRAAPDYDTGGTGEVIVEVKPGDTAFVIAQTLLDKGVVKSVKAFVQAADREPRSTAIQPGTYRLRSRMRAADALSMLLDLGNKVVNRTTLREGLSYVATFKELEKSTGIPYADFEAAAKDPVALGVPDSWFTRRDGKPSKKSVEGFLYPLSYEFAPGSTAESVLKEMVGQFLKVANEIGFVDNVQSALSVSPYEALIVASLSQAEAGVEEDLPHIARVAYNRAYKAKIPLQFDVTANYWLEINGKDPKHSGKLSNAELDDQANPYNTVSKTGLPIGPINSPGKEALLGAMNPTPGKNWLFFVVIDKSGKSAFADTVAEHDRNVQQACKNGIPLC